MQQKKQEGLIAIGLITALVLLLVPMFVIGKYNFISMDDYTYGTIVRDGADGQSFFGVLWAQAKNAYECYATWQGQYFVNWLIMVFLALGGADHYGLVLLLTLLPLVLAEFFLAYTVLGKGFKASFGQVCIAIVPVIVYHISFPPSTAEAFYWLCGAVTYTTSYALSLISLGLLVNLLFAERNSRLQNILSVIVLLILSVCLGGSNFVTGLFMLLVCGLFAVYGIVAKHKYRLIYFINLAVYTVCFLLTAFSPGATNRRIENADAQVSAIKAICMSLYDAAIYVSTWTFPFVLLLCLVMVPLFWKIVKNVKCRFPVPLLILVISFGMFAAQFTPNEYALGIIGTYRVQNIYRFQMIFWLLGNEFYLLGWLHSRFPDRKIPFLSAAAEKWKRIPLSSVIYGVLAGVLVLAAMYINVGPGAAPYKAYRDLRDGTAAVYYEEHQERLLLLEDKSLDDVVLEAFTNPPSALFFEDLKEVNNWENQHAAEYYGKNSILVRTKQAQ